MLSMGTTAFAVGHTVSKWQMTVLLPIPKVLNSSKAAFLLPRKYFPFRQLKAVCKHEKNYILFLWGRHLVQTHKEILALSMLGDRRQK